MGDRHVDGITPLDPDEAAGLIPSHIQTRAELNEWEQANITRAEQWLDTQQKRRKILTLPFLRELHKRMFGDTWRWAGTFRTTAKNIGVDVTLIQEKLKNLLDDATFWIQDQTFPTDEICVRFHHRLVQVHPFPNGNGRHGRLMTDALLVKLGRARFTWGSGDLDAQGDVRKTYIQALQQADMGDYSLLLNFVRS